MQIYRDGYAFKKVGVMALDLAQYDASVAQGNLFHRREDRENGLRLMNIVDAANKRFGDGMIFSPSQGIKEKSDWQMRRDLMSPCWTTRWPDVPAVS